MNLILFEFAASYLCVWCVCLSTNYLQGPLLVHSQVYLKSLAVTKLWDSLISKSNLIVVMIKDLWQ